MRRIHLFVVADAADWRKQYEGIDIPTGRIHVPVLMTPFHRESRAKLDELAAGAEKLVQFLETDTTEFTVDVIAKK